MEEKEFEVHYSGFTVVVAKTKEEAYEKLSADVQKNVDAIYERPRQICKVCRGTGSQRGTNCGYCGGNGFEDEGWFSLT